MPPHRTGLGSMPVLDAAIVFLPHSPSAVMSLGLEDEHRLRIVPSLTQFLGSQLYHGSLSLLCQGLPKPSDKPRVWLRGIALAQSVKGPGSDPSESQTQTAPFWFSKLGRHSVLLLQNRQWLLLTPRSHCLVLLDLLSFPYFPLGLNIHSLATITKGRLREVVSNPHRRISTPVRTIPPKSHVSLPSPQ